MGGCASVSGLAGTAAPVAIPIRRRELGVFKALKEGILVHRSAAQGDLIVHSFKHHLQESIVFTCSSGAVAHRNDATLVGSESQRQASGIDLKHRRTRACDTDVRRSQIQRAAGDVGHSYLLPFCSCIGVNGAKADGIGSVGKDRICRCVLHREVVNTEIPGRAADYPVNADPVNTVSGRREAALEPLVISIDNCGLRHDGIGHGFQRAFCAIVKPQGGAGGGVQPRPEDNIVGLICLHLKGFHQPGVAVPL